MNGADRQKQGGDGFRAKTTRPLDSDESPKSICRHRAPSCVRARARSPSAYDGERGGSCLCARSGAACRRPIINKGYDTRASGRRDAKLYGSPNSFRWASPFPLRVFGSLWGARDLWTPTRHAGLCSSRSRQCSGSYVLFGPVCLYFAAYVYLLLRHHPPPMFTRGG